MVVLYLFGLLITAPFSNIERFEADNERTLPFNPVSLGSHSIKPSLAICNIHSIHRFISMPCIPITCVLRNCPCFYRLMNATIQTEALKEYETRSAKANSRIARTYPYPIIPRGIRIYLMHLPLSRNAVSRYSDSRIRIRITHSTTSEGRRAKAKKRFRLLTINLILSVQKKRQCFLQASPPQLPCLVAMIQHRRKQALSIIKSFN